MTRIANGDIRRRVDDMGHVWFNGEDAAELLLRGYDIAALLIDNTPDIAVYNQWCMTMDKSAHSVTSAVPADFVTTTTRLDTWWLTEAYRDLPVRDIVLQRCADDAQRQRVMVEMDLFEARGLLPMLRLMFMLVAHFRQHDIVWGVGRGSSVASYVLFLIGVHKIDSLRYGLDISEFLHD